MNFNEFGLNEQLLEAISYMNFSEATPVQEKAIPLIMNGQDLIACAQTGTGKTAAFVLPILNKMTSENTHGINTLIIVPTRELALQIDQQIQGLSYFTSINVLSIYGGGNGEDWETEKKVLTQGADIIVATPGKLISHLKMGYVKFDKLKHLILDEADKMLDMGFYEDIKNIISFIPEQRQTLMFSATMPPKIRKLAEQILKQPSEINIAMSKPAEGVKQGAFVLYENQKMPLLKSLIKSNDKFQRILVFSSTKIKVREIARNLDRRSDSIDSISSDLDQKEREEVLGNFKSKKTRVLIATDILSRGIDIKDIDLIINYDVPHDAEDYVHRVGRTARAKANGLALTFINDREIGKFKRIEKLIEREVQKIPLPEKLGQGPEYKYSTRPESLGKKNYFKKGKTVKRR
ncbi:MAG: DEAD/DEAH box helicase [Cyclobacteriaceae bacterium]|nr:DEAD/DEAH box helicase [Cyclobacteriaceae bacterium]